MTRSAEELIEEAARAPKRDFFQYEYQGQKFLLHPYLLERGKPGSLYTFQNHFLGGVLEVMRQIRLLHPKWGPYMEDPVKAFLRGMRRRAKKGLPAMWETFDETIDKGLYVHWFLEHWIAFLDKTKPVAVRTFEPTPARAFEKMPVAEPIANAEPLPEGGLFDIF
jgi:hypothetical protein